MKPMKCSVRNCKNTKDVCPVSKICPVCDAWWKEFSKNQQRQDSQNRQQQARDQSVNRNRNLDSPSPSETNNPMITPPTSTAPQGVQFQAGSSAVFNLPAPPDVDITRLHNSYNQMISSGSESQVLVDMFALMLNIHSRQTEVDTMKVTLDNTIKRLEAVEAKIGTSDEVAERLGLAVRYLPLPAEGFSDLQLVRQVFGLIRVA